MSACCYLKLLLLSKFRQGALIYLLVLTFSLLTPHPRFVSHLSFLSPFCQGILISPSSSSSFKPLLQSSHSLSLLLPGLHLTLTLPLHHAPSHLCRHFQRPSLAPSQPLPSCIRTSSNIIQEDLRAPLFLKLECHHRPLEG